MKGVVTTIYISRVTSHSDFVKLFQDYWRRLQQCQNTNSDKKLERGEGTRRGEQYRWYFMKLFSSDHSISVIGNNE